MSNTAGSLTRAVTSILRPLVRLLLKQGIAFDALSDQLKLLYVEVAETEFAIPGKKQTVSRISTITGLTRKEVTKARSNGAMDLGTGTQQYNRAARVISGWVRDKEFCNKNGKPKDLNIDTGESNFAALVKKYSGDIPYRAIADELIRVGAIEKLDNNSLKLVKHAYIPVKNVDEKLNILGTDVSDLINTIYKNIYNENGNSLFQRKVAYDAVPYSSINKIKSIIQDKAQKCLEDIDKILVKHDSDLNKKIKIKGKCKIGLGIYYFEDIHDDE